MMWVIAMPRRFLLACLLLACCIGLARGDERRIALVVGVSNYKHAPRLGNTLNDARDIGKALERVGFEVELLIDPDRASLEAGVRKLRQRAQGADASLLYYAGHALELGGRNWLLPVETELQSDRDLRFEGLDLDSVLEQMEGTSRFSLVFLDACRDNPFRTKIAAGTREAPTRGLARVNPGSGTFIAFSTAPGTVAQDGTGANSPFAGALLKRIEIAGLELRRMLSEVRVDVRESTGGRQIPWENSALEGDFFFSKPAVNAPSAATVAPAQADRELAFWNSISASRDPADFRAYLAQFPQGFFAELARNRMAQLQVALAGPAVAPEASKPATLPPSPSVPATPTITAATPFHETMAQRFAAVAPSRSPSEREDIIHAYERLPEPKALVMMPGTTKTYRLAGVVAAENVEENVLEHCQVFLGSPCALVVVNEKLAPLAPNGQPPTRDMPRVHFAGRFSLDQVPGLRLDFLSRADIRGYAAAAGPKAAVYHPTGRLFVATAAASQRAAEDQALGACNSDPVRKGAIGVATEALCYLYAVGDQVVLPRRLTAPQSTATSIGEAIAMATRDRNLAGNYAADRAPKALAVELESGRAFRWIGGPSTEGAEGNERGVLEGCQLRFAQPCVLMAVNDELRTNDPRAAPRRNMPRIGYAGAYRADQVPLEWDAKGKEIVNGYLARKGQKAMAIRPSPGSIAVSSGHKSIAEAERKALEICNGTKESPYPCFLYAVNNTVVLPQRRTEASR
jgi:uncharacterized caspase-like protein